MDLVTDRKRKKNLIYCAVFFVVFIVYHLVIRVDFGDDTHYMHALDGTTLPEFLRNRYFTWSSRLVIETLLLFFVRHPVLWKIADTAVVCLLAYSLHELSHRASLYIVLSMLLIYPFVEMNTAGWIATTMNYLWPLSIGLYSLIIIDKIARRIDYKWWEVPLSLLALVIGVNAEQYCAVHIAMLMLYTAHIIIDRVRGRSLWILSVHYAISFASLIFILTCPGNKLRTASEVAAYMKDFYQKTLFDKVFLGFEATMTGMLSSYNILFLIFSVFLCICVFKKTKDLKLRIVSLIPALLAPLIQVTSLVSRFAGFAWLSGNSLFAVYVIMICCIIVSLFPASNDIVDALEKVFLFGVALASRVIMGFSPTIYASGSRTFLFCYALMIFIMLKLYRTCEGLFSEREKKIGRILLGSAAACMVVFDVFKIIYRSFDAVVAALV